MYEHKTMLADNFPSAEQLNDLDDKGWEVFLLIPQGQTFVMYLRRMKKAT